MIRSSPPCPTLPSPAAHTRAYPTLPTGYSDEYERVRQCVQVYEAYAYSRTYRRIAGKVRVSGLRSPLLSSIFSFSRSAAAALRSLRPAAPVGRSPYIIARRLPPRRRTTRRALHRRAAWLRFARLRFTRPLPLRSRTGPWDSGRWYSRTLATLPRVSSAAAPGRLAAARRLGARQ